MALPGTKVKKRPKKGYPVQHIVTPARALAEAKRTGEAVAALCGDMVTGDGEKDAGWCGGCVTRQLEKDDQSHDDRAQQRYEAGVERGKQDARRTFGQDLLRYDRELQAAEIEKLRAPRFVEEGKTLKFTFQDGSVATMRKKGISSVAFGPDGEGGYAVEVDGYVLIAHPDRALVKQHHIAVYTAVYGESPE